MKMWKYLIEKSPLRTKSLKTTSLVVLNISRLLEITGGDGVIVVTLTGTFVENYLMMIVLCFLFAVSNFMFSFFLISSQNHYLATIILEMFR